MTESLNAALRTCAALLCFLPALTDAAETRIAVASNFKPAMEELVQMFEAITSHQVRVSYGATGKHYAQIVNGAPHDIFLAADKERPQRLESTGHGIAGSRITYAIGELVLWGLKPGFRGEGVAVLKNQHYRFLSIANPRTAPYGRAAEQFLRRIDLWETLQSRIVRGENVAQAYAYVRSGNADIGLIALSQAIQTKDSGKGWFWPVPEVYYEPIEQQAILLTDHPEATTFLEFLQGPEAREIISNHGYSVP